MSDDDGSIEPGADPQLLLYDFSKHLVTLALLLLGGVLTLTQGQGAERIDQRSLVTIILLLALGGTGALSCADLIVRSRLKGKPVPRWLSRIYQFSAMAGVGLGTGAFLSGWYDLIQ